MKRKLLKRKNDVPKETFNTELPKNVVIFGIETHSWTASKKIPLEKLQKAANAELSEWVRANKTLIDKKNLADINSIITKFRNVLKSYSVPFMIQGMYLVKKENVLELIELLNELKEEIKKPIEELVKNYDKYKKEAEKILGPEFFNPFDYPDDIRSRFGIRYKVVDLSPSAILKDINMEVWKEQQNEIGKAIEQTKIEAMLITRKAFMKELEDVIGVLVGDNKNGKPKRIRSDTLEKFNKFYEAFTTKQNIFNDKELKQIIENAKNELEGISSKDLRDDVELKESVAEQIAEVGEILEKSIEDKEKIYRKLSW